jgi:periodic tryptophan protein 2
MSFNSPVHACSFSPDGKYFAISHNNGVQVWETPSLLVREFAPFVLHGTYTGHQDEVVGITWSKTGRYVSSIWMKMTEANSRYFLSTSRDMTARLYTLDPLEGFKPKSFGGHRDVVLGAWFSGDEKTVSHDTQYDADSRYTQ